jgi:type III secretion protein Q
MSALRLRQVSPLLAQVTRELGVGQRLRFSAQGQDAALTLSPLLAEADTPFVGTWLSTAVGPICLSDAEALLSLLGDTPLTLAGEQQPWYWQFFNQRLSPTIADLLAPIEPLSAQPMEGTVGCRIQVRLADQQVHAQLHATPETLIRLLRSAQWQARQRPVDESWQVTTPLIIGELSLTLEQLASLRPGDVVMPARCQFDSAGQGVLTLAGRQWAAQADHQAQHLFLRLSHEEHSHHDY